MREYYNRALKLLGDPRVCVSAPLTGREANPKRDTDWDHRAVNTPLNFFEPKR